MAVRTSGRWPRPKSTGTPGHCLQCHTTPRRRAGAAAASPPLGERSPRPRRGDGQTQTLPRAEAQRPAERTMLDVGVSWQGGESLGCLLREPSSSPRFTGHEAGTRAGVCPDNRSWPRLLPAGRQAHSRGPLSKCTHPHARRGTVQGAPGRAMTKLWRLQQCPHSCRTNPDPRPPEPGACPPRHGAGPHSCLDGRSHSGKARKQSQTRRTARGIRPARQDQEPAPGLAVPARAAV